MGAGEVGVGAGEAGAGAGATVAGGASADGSVAEGAGVGGSANADVVASAIAVAVSLPILGNCDTGTLHFEERQSDRLERLIDGRVVTGGRRIEVLLHGEAVQHAEEKARKERDGDLALDAEPSEALREVLDDFLPIYLEHPPEERAEALIVKRER